MSIIDVLLKISPALEKGRALKNADTWSNVVNAKLALATVFGFIISVGKMAGYDFPIPDDQIVILAGAIAAIGNPIVAYMKAATNPNRGLTRK